MKHFLLDTNVVIDYLIDRKPFSDMTEKLFGYAEKRKLVIYISAVSYTNIAYILRKHTTQKEILRLLSDLSEMVQTIDLTQTVIKTSLQANFKDFEDAVQYHCAISNKKIDAIITRNEKDFKHSDISILSPEEALSLIANS